MEAALLDNPALTVALALAAGMFAQSIARHLRIPGIVLLLAAGVVLGPELLGVVRPANLGNTLHTLVGFAVAVILFEGGLNLQARRLLAEARSIRQLVTLGAVVTAAGGALAARFILEWSWQLSALFGTLVIVTGPTVITPLLRRIRLRSKVATVLEAEGVLIDPIGAVIAVVALEIVLGHHEGVLAGGALDLAERFGFGIVLGTAGGFLLAALLRIPRIVPEGLDNVFALSFVIALFQLSNVLVHETGIISVTVAGLVVGNIRTQVLHDLREFKEQLTVMLIGMLFVLLAADVRLEHVLSLGPGGVWTVAVLIFVVRPLNVLAGTFGTGLKRKEKLFLCWLAPRGIVAAAVASLFAQSLHAAGIPGGEQLRALVFLVIGATVLLQGLTGGPVAGLLGLRRPSGAGYVILGASELGRTLARLLRNAGEEVVLIDSNQDACRAAEKENLRILHGSALSEGVLMRAGTDGRAGALAVTPNEAVNLLFTRKTRDEFKVPRTWVALRLGHLSVDEKMVHEAGSEILFGWPRNLDLWNLRLERKAAELAWVRRTGDAGRRNGDVEAMRNDFGNILLPLVVRRGRKTAPFDSRTAFRNGDEMVAAVFGEKRVEVDSWLTANGWERMPCPYSG